MTAEPIDPAERERLLRKYVTDPAPGPVAQAEQLARVLLDTRRDVEAWNDAQDCAWLNWRTPPSLGQVCQARLVRTREAMSRQSRGGGEYVHFFDDRNSFDERNGWRPFDPDNPNMQANIFGHIFGDLKQGGKQTVHVLRGGTRPGLFDEREHLGKRERPANAEPPNAGLLDFGDNYDFNTFMYHADQMRMLRFCEAHMPTGCRTGIGGGPTTLVAVMLGRDVFALHVCEKCLALAEAELPPVLNGRAD